MPEYYLTRTETAILGRCAAEIAQRAGPDCALVEFGSGSSVKSRLLLDAMSDLDAYVQRTVAAFPGIADGVAGMAFIEACVKSSARNGKWTKL